MTSMEKIRLMEEVRKLSDSEWEEFKKELLKVKDEKGSFIQEDKTEKSLYERVTELLHEIGIPANIKGYKYFREAIIYVIEKEETVNVAITKELYPTIAKKFDTTMPRVERAIRHSIEVAWEKHHGKNLRDEIFGYENRPTNSEAIATIAEYLKLH